MGAAAWVEAAATGRLAFTKDRCGRKRYVGNAERLADLANYSPARLHGSCRQKDCRIEDCGVSTSDALVALQCTIGPAGRVSAEQQRSDHAMHAREGAAHSLLADGMPVCKG